MVKLKSAIKDNPKLEQNIYQMGELAFILSTI